MRGPRYLAMRLEHGRLPIGPEDPLQRLYDLALRAVRSGTVEQMLHEVAIARGRLAKRGEGPLGLLRVAAAADGPRTPDLLPLQLGRDSQDRQLLVALRLVAVDPDHDPLAALDLLLQAKRSLRDLALGEVLLDRLHHPSQLVDLAEIRIGGLLHAVRQRLDEVGASQGVDRVGDPG